MVLKFAVRIVLLFLALAIFYRGDGGIVYALALMVPSIGLADTKESMKFSNYKEIKNRSNPLYAKKCYRENISDKKTIIKWSEFKLVCWCQIYAVVQDIIFLVLGIVSTIIGRGYKYEVLILFAAFLPVVIRQVIQIYYEKLLKEGLEKGKTKVIWPPFNSNENAYFEATNPVSIETKYNNFKDVERKLTHIFYQHAVSLWKNYHCNTLGEVSLFLSDESSQTRIFMLVDTQKKNGIAYDRDLLFREDMPYDILEATVFGSSINHKIDLVLKDFFAEYFGTLEPKNDICLTILICTESMTDYWNMVNQAITQKSGRYWLPAVMSFDTGTLFIARQKQKFGLRQYEKMKSELFNVLSLKNC